VSSPIGNPAHGPGDPCHHRCYRAGPCVVDGSPER
jgi:hypothetical protein